MSPATSTLAPDTETGVLAGAHAEQVAVLSEAARLRRVADLAEAQILVAAVAWADLHPALSAQGAAFDVDDMADDTLPWVAWDAPAEFALALGLSEPAGARLIHEALELAHRLPRIWTRVQAGEVQAWRARRIAQTTLGRPDEVAAQIDAVLGPIAHRVGPITTARLLEEAMLRLEPEDRELDHHRALDHRHATIHLPGPVLAGSQGYVAGVGELEATADLKDLLDFDHALSAVAAALKAHGNPEPVDVRRSQALGVLADPAYALQLLEHAGPDPRSEGMPVPDPGRPLAKQLVLHVHLTHDALTNAREIAGELAGELAGEVVGRCEAGGQRPLLAQQIREWCTRTDTNVRVLPVVDLNDHLAVEAYEVPDRLKTHIALRDRHCVFPWCTRNARACDHDHTVPYASGGATCSCNLAALCRHHHRLKTHTRWKYVTLEPGTYLWTAPHGHTYLVNGTGTTRVNRTDRTPPPQPYDGCWQ